jgi:TRAP-type uncharacterized transport system fused permease subunit
LIVASGIAQSNWLKTAFNAIILALPGFIIPYIFVSSNSMLLIGNPIQILRTVVTAIVGVFALAIATMGYYLTKVNYIERVTIGIAAICLIIPNIRFAVFGIILFISIYIHQNFKRKKEEASSVSI